MAKGKYEYVKSFEVQDKIMPATIIVVVIDGRNFLRFDEDHGFEKPRDKKALDLMKSCAKAVKEKFPDIVFSYGFSDEFSFVLRKELEFYKRRESKILSVLVSFFTSVFVMKWKDFFPKNLRFAPSFCARVVLCPTLEVLQTYLVQRQTDCHGNYLYDTCFWNLIARMKETEADSEAERQTVVHKKLEGTGKALMHELLFKEFKTNYNNLPRMFRRGTCLFRTEVEDKDMANGEPNEGSIKAFHSVINKSFWNKHPSLISEFGRLEKDIHNLEPRYIDSFQLQDKLMLSTWIVVRIDGCSFHRFSKEHNFLKPNDIKALNLMNSCGAAVLEEFQDIFFAYGESDEFSFVLRKDSKLYDRCRSEIVSVIVSFFTSMYIIKWKEFFQEMGLKYPPSFDGRAVCYPSIGILRDYLSWRQVDCYVNYQYNNCFQFLVDSGLKGCDAQEKLEGMQSQEKNDLLKSIDPNRLLEIYHRGSYIFWDKEKLGSYCEDSQKRIVIEHCDIIDDAFWKARPWILGYGS